MEFCNSLSGTAQSTPAQGAGQYESCTGGKKLLLKRFLAYKLAPRKSKWETARDAQFPTANLKEQPTRTASALRCKCKLPFRFR